MLYNKFAIQYMYMYVHGLIMATKFDLAILNTLWLAWIQHP